MSVTGFTFQQASLGLANGNMQMNGAHTWKVALSNGAGVVTQATTGIQAAKLFTDYTAISTLAEITGTGYTAGGVAVASPTGVVTTNVLKFTSATNPSWTTATFNANQAILYDSSASTIQLLCCWDFGGSIPISGGTLTLSINASGLMTITDN
jgi:hypothetical protein